MNQILVTNDEKGNTITGTRPIIRFFAIMLIVIALIFGGESGYKLYGNIKQKQDYPKAILSTEKRGSVLNLNFEDEIAISTIEYAWNDGKNTVLKGIGRKKVNMDIDIPQDNNYLNVSVVDVNGNKTKFESIKVEFSTDEDTIKPTISFEKGTTTGKLVISVKDDKELDYITYKWENGEEVVIHATPEKPQEIIEEIGVEKGTKEITVVAFDKAGNKFEKTKTIIGSTGAKITVGIANDNFVVKVKGDNTITKILYTHNEIEHTVPDIPKDAKEFEFTVPLKEGINYLKINVFENEIMTEYKCKKTK